MKGGKSMVITYIGAFLVDVDELACELFVSVIGGPLIGSG